MAVLDMNEGGAGIGLSRTVSSPICTLPIEGCTNANDLRKRSGIRDLEMKWPPLDIYICMLWRGYLSSKMNSRRFSYSMKSLRPPAE